MVTLPTSYYLVHHYTYSQWHQWVNNTGGKFPVTSASGSGAAQMPNAFDVLLILQTIILVYLDHIKRAMITNTGKATQPRLKILADFPIGIPQGIYLGDISTYHRGVDAYDDKCSDDDQATRTE